MAFVDVLETTHSIQVGRSGLALVRNDMRHLHVDAMICYSSTSLTLHSHLAQRLIAAGGNFIRAESAKHVPAHLGEAILLPAGKLPSRYLIAAVTNHLRNTPSLADIAACMRAIAGRAEQLQLRSLAIPLLRAGRALDSEDVLRATLAPLFDHCSAASAITHLLIVNDPEDSLHSFEGIYRDVAALFAELQKLGNLRAQSYALRDLEWHLQAHAIADPKLIEDVLLHQIDLQRSVQHILEQSQSGPAQQAIGLELQQSRHEQERLAQALAKFQQHWGRARALGA